MTDRVRMVALSTFHNALIEPENPRAENGQSPVIRPDAHTVSEGDVFSTHEDHAKELERLAYAKRVDGEAAPASERAERLRAIQTPATAGSAIVTGGPAAGQTLPVGKAAEAPAT